MTLITMLREFLRDESAAAGLEFVTTLPLLVGTMVFTSEYGRALQVRMVLDSATQDVARFLARSPGFDDGSGNLVIEPPFLTAAQSMMESRMNGGVDMSVDVATVDATSFRTDYHVVEVTTTVRISMPLLTFINDMIDFFFELDFFTDQGADPADARKLETGLTMNAQQQARWTAATDVGASSCGPLDRGLGLCG